MSTKTVNARIQSKADTEANWDLATTFIPKAGEIIVYTVDTSYAFPRLKIGDGVTTVSNLPFVNQFGLYFDSEGYLCQE